MFCDELRLFRQKQGMTIPEFAKKLGVSGTLVSRHENLYKVYSHWNYTEKINKVFGTDFPDVSYCRTCGCEIFGRDKLCKSCRKKKEPKAMPKKQNESLKRTAQNADKLNLSYGAFVAGVREKEKARDVTPGFLCLGKTITI